MTDDRRIKESDLPGNPPTKYKPPPKDPPSKPPTPPPPPPPKRDK
jgi:hypothetical protein